MAGQLSQPFLSRTWLKYTDTGHGDVSPFLRVNIVEETFAPLRYFPFLFLVFAVGLDGISWVTRGNERRMA